MTNAATGTTRPTDERALERHFAFGENWRSFLDTVTAESIAQAVAGLERLFPSGELQGKRFLDVGCGSALAMLAAARLGAASVEGVDIDPQSVEAARTLLSRELGADGIPWAVRVRS